MIHSRLFTESLERILKIPSYRTEAEPNAPFGKNCKLVLEEIVTIATEWGFHARISNDVAAVIEWGEGEQYLGIFSHLDVVPEGEGWSVPPYQLNDCGDRFIARGILDNKGPGFTCLYAMYQLKQNGFVPKTPIRLVFGSAEETGSEDMDIFLKHETPPAFGFTPDCKFPAIYAERGLINIQLNTTLPQHTIERFSDVSGEQTRASVPDNLSITYDGKQYSAKGVRSPSNAPELGVNAIPLLASQLLASETLNEECRAYFLWITESLAEKHFGEGLGIDFEDKESGKTILTPLNFFKTDSGFSLELAIRYPVSVKEEEILATLSTRIPLNTTMKVVRSMPSVNKDKNAWWIQEMSKVYEEITGLDGTPLTTTGATYARSVPNIIAFGPSFPGQKGIAHNADEYMFKEDFEKLYHIYKESIMRLTQEKF